MKSTNSVTDRPIHASDGRLSVSGGPASAARMGDQHECLGVVDDLGVQLHLCGRRAVVADVPNRTVLSSVALSNFWILA